MIESNPAFIVAAYVVTWIALLGYSFRLARKNRQVRSEYEATVYKSSGENE